MNRIAGRRRLGRHSGIYTNEQLGMAWRMYADDNADRLVLNSVGPNQFFGVTNALGATG